MEDRRSEDYNPPKPKMVAFSGAGHTLGKCVDKLQWKPYKCIMYIGQWKPYKCFMYIGVEAL